jgi:hypothetical protein
MHSNANALRKINLLFAQTQWQYHMQHKLARVVLVGGSITVTYLHLTSTLLFDVKDESRHHRSCLQRIVGFAFNGENVSQQMRYVDHMIIAESTFSQRGRPKELLWRPIGVPDHLRVTYVVERNNHYSINSKWGQESQVRRVVGRGVQDFYNCLKTTTAWNVFLPLCDVTNMHLRVPFSEMSMWVGSSGDTL